MLQAIEANTAALEEYQKSSASYSPMWFVTFTTSAKSSRAIKLCFMLTKYSKTFDLPKYFNIDVCIPSTLQPFSLLATHSVVETLKAEDLLLKAVRMFEFLQNNKWFELEPFTLCNTIFTHLKYH